MTSLFYLALALSLLAAVAGGIVGSYIVVKRITMIAGSISHSIFAGMGVCIWLQKVYGLSYCDPFLGALVTGLFAACLKGFIHVRYKEREDAILSGMWSVGMAIGVLFLALTPGAQGDMHDYLFGNLVWVSFADIWIMLAVDALIIIAVALFHRRFLAVCFDEEGARLGGLATKATYIFMLMLITLAIVALIRVVGIILILTLLAIPAMIASIWARSFFGLVIGSIALGMLFCAAGCTVGYSLDLPLAPMIAIISGAAYIGTLGARRRLA